MAFYQPTPADAYVVIHSKSGSTSPPMPDKALATELALKLADLSDEKIHIVKIIGSASPVKESPHIPPYRN